MWTFLKKRRQSADFVAELQCPCLLHSVCLGKCWGSARVRQRASKCLYCIVIFVSLSVYSISWSLYVVKVGALFD